MNIKLILQSVLPATAVFAALLALPVQAATYLCTGLQDGSSSIYFNGDLTDPICDTDEVETALGIIIDTNLITGSKSDSVGEPITGWIQSDSHLGALTVTDTSDTSGNWNLTSGGIAPLFFVDKYDSGYDIYIYTGPGTDPFSDSWDGANRGDVGASCTTDGGSVNCGATTSHISVYGGVVPIPAAVWLFGSGLLGLVGVARRKRS